MPSFLSLTGTRVECPSEVVPTLRRLLEEAGIASASRVIVQVGDGNVLCEVQVDPQADLGQVAAIALRISPLPDWYLDV
jgi:hypothetical protein